MDKGNGNRYLLDCKTVIDIAVHKTIAYNERYIPNTILTSLFTDNRNKYIIKELGAGFTYGCLNTFHNLVVIVPNIQIVKDKEINRFSFDNKNTLFFYGGSEDKPHQINDHKRKGNLIIMCTIDQLDKIYEQVRDFVWIVDEVHSLNVGGMYRPSIMRFFHILKERTENTIVVTATPSIVIPHIFNDYHFVKLQPTEKSKPIINVSYDNKQAIRDIKLLIAKEIPVAVFSNSKYIISSLMQLTDCSMVIGGVMKQRLKQYDNTNGKAFEKNNDALLFINTSAGLEGHDIYTTPDAHTYIFSNSKLTSLSYTLPAMLQATGRLRNGSKSINFIITPPKEDIEIETTPIRKLANTYLQEAKELKSIGSEKLIDQQKVFYNNGELTPNYFGIYGMYDANISTVVLNSDERKLRKYLNAYGYNLGEFDATKNTATLPRLKIRVRINNVKRLSIEEATENFYALKNAFNPMQKATTTTPPELKVVLLGIAEMILEKEITEEKEINRMFNKITPDEVVELPTFLQSVINDIKQCDRLYRRFKKENMLPLTTSSQKELDSCFKEYGGRLNPTQENKIKTFTKRQKTQNAILRKNARLYQSMFIFGALNKEILTVKNREYSPVTSLSMQSLNDLTPEYILECDITSANPQFIDNILGSNIGTTVYENLVASRNANTRTPDITRQEAKVIYNTALNKADEHYRRKDDTLKIFLECGYTQKQAEVLYEKTKIKGQIYIEMTRQERIAINNIANIEPINSWFGGTKVRRHDSILYYSHNLDQLQELEKMLLENMTENLIYHTKIYEPKISPP